MTEGAPADRVIIVGQGYVGLPLAVRAVEQGYDVVGFDLDARKIDELAAGSSFIEDIPDARLQAVLATGRFHPSAEAADLAGFDIAVISVPTPLSEGTPDLTYIESSAEQLGAHLTKGACVILESTTYPGTTEELVAPILEQASGLTAGDDFQLGYSPERIDPGNATWTLETTPKVVSGIDEASLARVKGFYDDIVVRTVPVRSPKEAELTKLLENTFRHVNIALVNELAMFARRPGHRRVGGHRRRREQAVRLHAVPARPRRGRPLPADRPVVPVVAGQAVARPDVPVRGAGQRRQRAHARLRRAPPRPPGSTSASCR